MDTEQPENHYWFLVNIFGVLTAFAPALEFGHIFNVGPRLPSAPKYPQSFSFKPNLFGSTFSKCCIKIVKTVLRLFGMHSAFKHAYLLRWFPHFSTLLRNVIFRKCFDRKALQICSSNARLEEAILNLNQRKKKS
jgi:hypothetical protein